MNWAVYIAVMALLIIVSPALGWWRLRSQWHRHPAGSKGTLRDQIVTRIPWAITVIAFTVYTALGGLGKIAAPARDWMAMIYGAIGLAMFACSGFLPPIMDARQRLTRLSKKPSGKTATQSATGA